MTVQKAGTINQDDDLRRDHYIPLGKKDLVEVMVEQAALKGDDAQRFREFASLLESRFHHEFYEILRNLCESYAAYDPDCIIVDLEHEGEASRREKKEMFFSHLHWLLEKANYSKLAQEDIQDALTAAKMFGIRLTVDFDSFDHMSVYVRGRKNDHWTVRRWYRWFKQEEIEVPVYRRLVLVFQYATEGESAEASAEPTDGQESGLAETLGKPGPDGTQRTHVDESEDGEIFLKIFKNIPTTDIDILLPASRVKLSLIDRGKIILPTISGLGVTAFKIVKTSLLASLFTGFAGTLAFFVLVGGTIGYGVKSFFGYQRTKDKYQLNLTRHLYYQNLGNNRGVLFRMLNDAEEQEFREALIAYFLLWHEGRDAAWDKQELDRRAEAWLFEIAGIHVDFEDEDALAKLTRLNLAEESEAGWKVLPLLEASEVLRARWQDLAELDHPTLTEISPSTTSRTSSD